MTWNEYYHKKNNTIWILQAKLYFNNYGTILMFDTKDNLFFYKKFYDQGILCIRAIIDLTTLTFYLWNIW